MGVQLSTFTLRDSPSDMVNLTIWSNGEEAAKLKAEFRVGMVVEVVKPKVMSREVGRDTNFNPQVTSPFQLSFQEGRSTLCPHLADVPHLTQLLNVPSKASSTFLSISDIITKPGLVNVDFADVRSVMASAGTALLGIGVGSGRSRASEAAMAAMSSPLLESARIDGAKGCVINISGGRDMTLEDMTTASEVIYDVVDPEANIIVGAVVDEALEGEIHVTVIATGFEGGNQYVPQRTLRTELSDSAAQSNLEMNESGVRIPAFLQNRQNRDQD